MVAKLEGGGLLRGFAWLFLFLSFLSEGRWQGKQIKLPLELEDAPAWRLRIRPATSGVSKMHSTRLLWIILHGNWFKAGLQLGEPPRQVRVLSKSHRNSICSKKEGPI